MDLSDLSKLAKFYGVHPAALLVSPQDANPKIDDMREASSLAQEMENGARHEWLALGRRIAGKPSPD